MKYVKQQTEGDCGFNIHSHLPDFGFKNGQKVLARSGSFLFF